MNCQLMLAGTVPSEDISLVAGTAEINSQTLTVGNKHFSINRGTAAMIGAACAVASYFDVSHPFCVIGGDIGKKTGSRLVYHYIRKNIAEMQVSVLCLHYIVPDIGLHNQMLAVIGRLKEKPCLIADAGFMYAAKASGRAASYDLFLPDIGELAFLADDKASHPAYTRGFLTGLEGSPVKLIERAYNTGNASRHLCVKGKTDRVCSDGTVAEEIDTPVVEALEAIGGTGDTITGMVAGLVSHGVPIKEACVIACRANRKAGEMVNPTPATQIHEIIAKIPQAVDEVINY